MSSCITALSRALVIRNSPKASGSSSSQSRAPKALRPPRFALSRPGRPGQSFGDGSSRSREDRDGSPRAQPRRNVDGEAMALREQGRSFAAIARTLGLKRAADAREAFLRELRSRPDEERQLLVQHELERLDKLEARVRARDAEEPDKLQT